jgi:hypothetical protein
MVDGILSITRLGIQSDDPVRQAVNASPGDDFPVDSWYNLLVESNTTRAEKMDNKEKVTETDLCRWTSNDALFRKHARLIRFIASVSYV